MHGKVRHDYCGKFLRTARALNLLFTLFNVAHIDETDTFIQFPFYTSSVPLSFYPIWGYLSNLLGKF